MANNTRSASEVANHQRQIATLYLEKGKTQSQIAELLGISQATVSRDLTSLRKRWQREAQKRTNHALGEKLEQFQHVQSAAWGGWDDSRGKITTTITRKRGDKEYTETQVTTSPGDPRFLEQVQKALLAEMKLLGLDTDKSKLSLPPETILLIQALGLNINDVVKTLSDILKEAAQSQGNPKNLSSSEV